METMTKKKCFKCQRELPLSEFYAHKMMGDGHLNKCKSCTKSDVTKHRNDNVEQVRAYDRLRSKTPKRLGSLKASCKQYRATNPRKYAAHTLVNSAISCGRLERKTCEKCGAKAHAHHENYDKPLEVKWLCAVHHSQRHKEMKREGIEP